MTTTFDDTSTYRLNTAVLRFALRVLGWTQAEFASRIHVHESTVSRMLKGEPTTAEVASRIAQAIPGLTAPEIVDMPGFSPGLPRGATDAGPA